MSFLDHPDTPSRLHQPNQYSLSYPPGNAYKISQVEVRPRVYYNVDYLRPQLAEPTDPRRQPSTQRTDTYYGFTNADYGRGCNMPNHQTSNSREQFLYNASEVSQETKNTTG